MSDQQKRSFLSDFPSKAQTIGLKKTVEILLPCLVQCFNSDEVIHPDIYDVHAGLLFGNMGKLIDFLSKEGRKHAIKKLGNTPDKQSSLSDSQSDYSESDFGDSDAGESEVSGYKGIVTILVDQIYAEFFEPERIDETLKKEILPKVLEQMVQITKVLSEEDRISKIVPIILNSVTDEEDEERRLTSIALVDELAEVLGEKIC